MTAPNTTTPLTSYGVENKNASVIFCVRFGLQNIYLFQIFTQILGSLDGKMNIRYVRLRDQGGLKFLGLIVS